MTSLQGEGEWCPIYKWGQKARTVYVTIFVPCLDEERVSVSISSKAIEFRAFRIASFAGGKTAERNYRLSLQLREPISQASSNYFLRHDHVRLELAKLTPQSWRSLQAAHVPRNPNERPDFDHMGDDDDDDEDEDDRPSRLPSSRSNSACRSPGSRPGRGVSVSLRIFSDALKAIGMQAWDLPPIAICFVYVLLCPFSKVEESFNLQATHDLMYHGLSFASYDHHEFPGVVPRTFLGALVVSLLSAPMVKPPELLGASKYTAQLTVRCVLGLLSCAALLKVQRATRRQFGANAARAFVLLTCVQFHWLFYASRTLPNTFGGILCSLATACWLDADVTGAVRLLTVAVVIFRFELLLLLGPLCVLFLARGQIGIAPLILNGIATGVLSLLLTVLVDSMLWRRPLWPEGAVFYANTVLNMSAEYGASPFYWYFTSALPRALLIGLPLAAASLYLVPRARQFVLVPLAFVAVYSLLPHKELRFVLYVVPPLNVAAAAALARLHVQLPSLKAKASTSRVSAVLGRALLCAALLASFLLSMGFLRAASLNYPGAHALLALHRLEAKAPKPYVHIGVDAAMSGVSRFLEQPRPWRYSKEEGLDASEYGRFSHLLTHASATVPGFVELHTEVGFVGLSISPPFFRTEPKVKVLKRKRERYSAAAETSRDFNF
mmetsp:Transcript_45746/g.106727  ORF Transcript_45746/g.106727 Transcript_45746/m.106727 type:complete len:665 (-) Transcript_45746:569-2563(-)|eukprot:CAMPEP_0119368626 /NCGR_PEP_ID=MMETSP1334-20130426/15251_1 /TAXON_ID=127549 /ORGANISM="Calcidiscus leptoporus, Strain RCC1130" /LENGTH=664 /DNA_ID=CAMNT_0007385311 /DNA_START=27 /DNA_END=2021 /DNA_ORIENTATION=-